MSSTPETTETWEAIDPDTTEEQLAKSLAAAGIPVAEWGQGSAKTVGHLLAEIRSGESKVSLSPDGSRIHRQVGVVWVDVLHLAASGAVYALRESRQDYADGRVRIRSLDSSLGEKMKPDEDPAVAADRAIAEELGLEPPETLHFLSSKQTEHTPDAYPGLTSQYDTHNYVATLGHTAFNPAGYIEHQADKTNYYGWDMLRPPS